ncbi:acyltransferase family protein [Acinetobacter sp. ANC 5383]
MDALFLLCMLSISIFILSWIYSKRNIGITETTGHITTLDGLRGILASSVVAHHFYITYIWKTAGQWVAPQSNLLNNLGASAVSLFFLITGYLFLNKIRNVNINWGKLYISRIKRIYPLFLFVLTCIVLITISIIPINQNNSIDFIKWLKGWLFFQESTFSNFESGLIIAHVQWTLLYEWKFYLALPLFYILWHRKIPNILNIIISLALVIFISKYKNHLYALFFLSVPAILYKQKIKDIMMNYSSQTHVFIFLLSIITLFFTKGYSIIQMLLLSIIFTFIANGYSYFNVLNHKGIKILGDMSYSIYLTHGLVLYTLFTLTSVIDFNHINIYQYILLFPITLTIVTLLSNFTYKFIEKPFLNIKIK